MPVAQSSPREEASTSPSSPSEQTGWIMSDAYRFGIEEEYFLVDARTKSVAAEMPLAFLEAAMAATAGQIKGELPQPRIEAATVPHVGMLAARDELRHLRVTLGAIAAEHGLAIMAAGTHPTAALTEPQPSAAAAERVLQRNMLCALHVHVELPDPEDRTDMMVRMMPYLPLFVALSTSSPFWQSR